MLLLVSLRGVAYNSLEIHDLALVLVEDVGIGEEGETALIS